MQCYYCEKNPAVDLQFINPLTKEIHPTCAACLLDFELLEEDKKKFATLGKIGKPLLLASILCFAFVGWKIGLATLALGLVLSIYPTIAVGNRSTARFKKVAAFAKENGLYWMG